MTDVLLESRRELRQRAFQALMSLEYEGDAIESCRFAYTYDKDEEQTDAEDKKIAQHLKAGWTVERLTLVEKNILRLGIFEITEFDTPERVAVNEAIELSKQFSDEKSSKFINGILSQFITEEKD